MCLVDAKKIRINTKLSQLIVSMNYIYLSICIGMSLIGRCQECPDDIWIFHKSHKKVPELLAAAGRRVKETVLTLSLEKREYDHHGNTSSDRPSQLYPATYVANTFIIPSTWASSDH